MADVLDGVGTAAGAVRLLLLTSEWSTAADAVARTRVDALLEPVGDAVQRVELRQASGDAEESAPSSSSGWITKTVDAAYVATHQTHLFVLE